MRVGLVYDLRADYRALGFSEEACAEFDSPETVDALAAAIERQGCRVTRVGRGLALAERLAGGERFDLVFSIAEGLGGRNREAQVPALCELYGQPFVFSDALTMAATLDKGVAKRLVRDAGLPTPPFRVLHDSREAAGVDLPFPVFVKPLHEGTGMGCEAASVASGRVELEAAARDLLVRFAQPVIVEALLTGREFTVGIVGNAADARVIAVMEVLVDPQVDTGVYSLVNKELCERYVHYHLPEDDEAWLAGERALEAYHALHCLDAARIDLRSDASGSPQFLEANPIAGLHPTHSDLPILSALAGHDYDWLIGEILRSACLRLGIGYRDTAVAVEAAAAVPA
jgi:D-alanine-D-alanine ligase